MPLGTGRRFYHLGPGVECRVWQWVVPAGQSALLDSGGLWLESGPEGAVLRDDWLCPTGVGQVLSPGFQSHRGLLGGPGASVQEYFCAWFWPETRAEPLTGALEERPHGQQQENPRRAAGLTQEVCEGSQARAQLLQAARPGVRASAVKDSQLITAPGSTRPHKPASHTREVKGAGRGSRLAKGQISTPPGNCPHQIFQVTCSLPDSPRTPPGNLPKVTFSP